MANLGSCLAVIQKRSSMLIAEYLNFSDKFNQILSEEKLLIQWTRMNIVDFWPGKVILNLS